MVRSCGRESFIACCAVGPIVVTVSTGWVAGSEVMVVTGVAGTVTCCVAGANVACWLVQPEQKIRVIKAAITIIQEISFMILLIVEMIVSSIRFFDHGPGGVILSHPGLDPGFASWVIHRNIKTIRYIEE